MKKTKTEKGITLVALIITIIVLLILAVVAIGVVTGDGILFHAKDASTKYAEKAEEENSTIQGYAELIKEQTGGASGGGGSIASTTTDGVPIPKGFQYVEGTKEDGIVIKREDADESQFVWVPVEEINDMVICQAADRTDEEHVIDQTTLKCSACGEATKLAGRLYGESGTGETFNANLKDQKYIPNTAQREPDVVSSDKSYANFGDQLQAEFNEMVKSVAKYKGFYIGRYETSLDENGKAQSVYGATSASAAENSANTWYGLYQKQKEYYTEFVQGSMIWGSQYDAMMNWMGDLISTGDEIKQNPKRLTGTCETDVVKKVYDLYGNSEELTLEASGTGCRQLRGGMYGTSRSPGYHYGTVPTFVQGHHGSRLTLYIR